MKRKMLPVFFNDKPFIRKEESKIQEISSQRQLFVDDDLISGFTG